MKNIKLLIGFSIFGFLLSLVSGFFSKSSFGVVIGHAFLFAVIFAILAVVVQFVFQKFLEFDSVDDSFATETRNQPTNQSKQSHTVDLYVEAENFPQDDGDAKFFVSNDTNQFLFGNENTKTNIKNTKQAEPQKNNATEVAKNNVDDKKLNKLENNTQKSDVGLEPLSAKVSKPMPQATNENVKTGFVPVSLEKNAQAVYSIKNDDESNNTAFNDKKSENVKVAPETVTSASGDELDVLPDLEDMSNIASQTGIVPSTPDEKEEYNLVKEATKDASEVAEGQDAVVMAKAISTMLSMDK